IHLADHNVIRPTSSINPEQPSRKTVRQVTGHQGAFLEALDARLEREVASGVHAWIPFTLPTGYGSCSSLTFRTFFKASQGPRRAKTLRAGDRARRACHWN